MNNSILYSAKIGGYVEVRNIENLINSITKISKHNDYEIHLFYSNELKIEVYNYIKNLNQKMSRSLMKKNLAGLIGLI